jgi:3-oxoacyl-[acyl-carrier-protein] synthase III
VTVLKIPGVAVRGVVCTVPGQPLAVQSLGSSFDPTEAEKVARTVGLRELYRVEPGTTAGDLCTQAARILLEELGWEPASVDGIIFVSQTPDHFLPATACVVHGALGLPDTAFAFDVGMGCSGYVYGLWMASQFVAGGARRVLMLAGDTVSRIISPEDKSVAMLFGDAGSATAVETDPSADPAVFTLGTDGQGSRNLIVPGGAFRKPTESGWVREDDGTGNRRGPADLYMDGLAIFNFTLQRVPALVQSALAGRGWSKEDPDAFVFHQANGFILGKLAKKMALPADRVPINIDRYGNTSLASIPLLLADDLGERLRAGPMRAVLAGFGVGYSWAGAALTLGPMAVARVCQVDA